MCIGTACIASSLSELTYGMIISPITRPALSMLNAGQVGHELLEQRRDEQQREVAVDDRRHRAEQFQRRLDDLPQPLAASTR